MIISPPERFDEVVEGLRLVGLSVRIRESRTGAERRVWVAVGEEHSAHLSDRQDVFLPTLALYAMLIGEDLDCSGLPVDPFFLRNVNYAARQYSHWFPGMRPPKIIATTAGPSVRPGAKLAAFCSGGVDGIFTVLRHTAENPDDVSRSSRQTIDHAYHVLYSAEPAGAAAHGVASTALAADLAEHDVELIKVYSNLYLFAPQQTSNYSMIGHGAAFASMAHVLSQQTGATMLGSSHTFGFLCPYGSTPEVDPLYSSGAMAFINDGAHYSRMEKVAYLCRTGAAMETLNVCDRRSPGADYSNCSRCHKCIRTMTAIDLCGRSGARCSAFDWTQYSPADFGRLQLRGAGVGDEHVFAEEIRDAATGVRPDLEESAKRALARSRYFKLLFVAEDALKKMSLGSGMRRSLKSAKGQILSLLGAVR